MKNFGLKTALVFCAVLIINTFLLVSLYQRTWAPHEDGYFAHVAERLLQGEKLYRDVESRHAGYIHFVNAGTMAVLGTTLAAPRVPVAFLSLLQSILLFLLFVPHGLFAAALAALISTILGYLQCLTPSAHWYCLFLLILMITVLYKIPRTHPLRLFLLGFLLGLIVLFRQLTGFFAGAGLLIYLLTENRESQEKSTPFLAWTLLLLSSALLFLNFKDTFEINGFILFGLWPCFLMLWAFFHTRLSNRETFLLSLKLAAGFLLACLPLLFYLARYHAFSAWFDDTVIRSSRMLKTTPYQTWSSYALYQAGGALLTFRHQGLRLTLNGLYWTLLPLTGFLNGLLLFLALLKRKTLSPQDTLPLMAVFYGIVSYTLQIPIYLYYSVSLSLVSLIWLSKTSFRKLFPFVSLMGFFLLIVGFYYHAAQPSQRGFQGILTGERHLLEEKKTISKLGLKIQQKDGDNYEELINEIKAQTDAKDPIFIFPNNPELYFLSGRRNPFRFTLTPTALQSQDDVQKVILLLQKTPPRLILYNPKDKYNTALGLTILEETQKSYSLKKTLPPFEIYGKNS